MLRGINITGNKIIRMEDLRKHVADCGATNVRTYIQAELDETPQCRICGNQQSAITCEHPAKTSRQFRSLVEEHLAGTLGYRVKTLVRTPKELRAISPALLSIKVPASRPPRLCVRFTSVRLPANLSA